MKISVQRFITTPTYTGGFLVIDGKVCGFTMEDEKRSVKVKGETRIPAGVYEVVLQKAGLLHERYSTKFPFHKGMLLIKDVPGFSGIMIHIGNTEKDTAGCILVGLNFHMCCSKITDSTRCYEQIYPQIVEAIQRREKVEIHVIDELIYS
jgi:hypothetical protein